MEHLLLVFDEFFINLEFQKGNIIICPLFIWSISVCGVVLVKKKEKKRKDKTVQTQLSK